MPPGVDLPPTLKASDAISQTLNSLQPTQLLDILTQMKAMAVSEPAKLTDLLQKAPQLSYAAFQALILMNLVDPKILAQVVEQATQQAPAPMAQPQQPPPQQYSGYPPPNPMAGMPPRPPPQAYPPQPPPQQAAAPAMSQEQLLQQVLAMDQRTIDSLPPADRAQIIALRQSMGVR